jgi:hypothetical protein
MSRTMLLASSLVCALATAARAQPSEIAATSSSGSEAHGDPGWRLEFGSETRWLRNASAAAVTTDPFASTALSAARRVTSIPFFRGTLDLGLEATWTNGEATGTLFQTLGTTVGDNEWRGGVRAAWRLHRLLAVTGRAAAGVTRTDLRIAPMSSPEMASVDDHRWGSVATATVGLELDAVHVQSFALGLGLELGYVETSAVTMHAYPSDRPDPNASIETTYASIGHLDLDGWSLRFGMHMAF